MSRGGWARPVHRWTSIVFTLAVMFVLSGLQLFVTGFLADLVVGCEDRIEKLERTVKKGERG